MPKCRDCIHSEICASHLKAVRDIYGAVMSISGREVNRLESALSEISITIEQIGCDGCDHFKDRSRFVELDPCEGGEIITLEDAIAHCYEVADGKTDACEECRAEHMMFGAWLRELKLRREQEMQKPLDIGDTVHFVLRELDEIDLKEYRFTVGNCAVSDTVQFVTEIGTFGFWVGDSPREFAPDYDDFYYWCELGETAFLCREEAEQALKERENSD